MSNTVYIGEDVMFLSHSISLIQDHRVYHLTLGLLGNGENNGGCNGSQVMFSYAHKLGPTRV
jgi:hypothetical protein